MTRAELRAACSNPEQLASMAQLTGVAEDQELAAARDIELWKTLARRWLDADPARRTREDAKAHLFRVLRALGISHRRGGRRG